MSIVYFPRIYPDELVSSVLARYYAQSGYLAYIFCANDIFTKPTARPDIEFISDLKQEVIQMLCKDKSLEKIILKHTMYPYYAKFLPYERRKQAFQLMYNLDRRYYNMLAIPKMKNGKKRYLRFCPKCVEQDRNIWGETYWHRQHQMIGVNVCPEHGCRLIESDVEISGKASPDLQSAEQCIKEGGDITYGTEIEKKLAAYIGNVFQEAIAMDNRILTGQFLYSRLEGTKYVSIRGEQRNMKELTEDFMIFYQNLSQQGLTELWQLQKIFTGYRFNFFEVCQLALFLNIEAADLSDMKLPDKMQKQVFDEKVKEFRKSGMGCNQIARKLGVSGRTISNVGKEQKKRKQKQYKSSCGCKTADWKKIDDETLPLVKDAIRQIYGEGRDRPHKVTSYAVSRKLNIPDKRLLYLPKCKKEVEKYHETQEEYWSREVVWAVNTLQRERKSLNWKGLRVITNMKKENLIRSLPCLEKLNPVISEVIKELI